MKKNLKKIIGILVATLFGLPAIALTMSDGQIASFMRTSNNIEIESAQIAESKAQNPEVIAFAERVIMEHKQNNDTLISIARRQRLNFDSSEATTDFLKDSVARFAGLKMRANAEFDRAYIQSQIDLHESLIEDIAVDFSREARNEELKVYLQNTRARIQSRLDETRRIIGML